MYYDYNFLKKTCKKAGCFCPNDAMLQIANTPAFVRTYFEEIGKKNVELEKNSNVVKGEWTITTQLKSEV